MDNQPLIDDPKQKSFESTANVNNINIDNNLLIPLVFDPNLDSIDEYKQVSESELIKLQQDEINDSSNVWNRIYRMILILFLLGIFLPLTACLKNKLHIFTIYGFAVLCCCIGYAIHLYYILFKAYFTKNDGLYRVQTLNAIPPKWASMSIAYRALLYKSQPIESISEFSAIQGGVASTMMFGTACCTMTILSCAFMNEIHQHSFELTVDDIMIMIGAFGLVIIGTFELDPNNDIMKYIHYFGCILSMAIFFSFNYQQFYMIHLNPNKYTYNRIWYPLLLDIISFIGAGVWIYCWKLGADYQKKINNIEQVHVQVDTEYISKLSVLNLGAEGIYFVGSGVSLASWMIFYPYAYCPEFNS